VWTLKKGFARFSYSEITSLSLHDVGHALALQIATPSHPASELGSSFGTLPERTANCLPGVGGGEALNVGTAVEIHELRRRAGLQQPQRDIIAWVPCCRVFSQAGIVLSKEITHDLVFCEDRLIFQQSVDGRREATIPYSDVVVLEVYGTTAAGNRAAALAGDTITAALTGVHSLMTLQTTTVELYLLNTWAYEPAVRLCLSPVFNRLRQRRTAPVGAAREKALSGDVLADRLTRITNWHAQGMLTDEEFAALRAKLRGW
jgi:hypothetical protein